MKRLSSFIFSEIVALNTRRTAGGVGSNGSNQTWFRGALISSASLMLAACSGTTGSAPDVTQSLATVGAETSVFDPMPPPEHISLETKFTQDEFKVAASPRVTALKRPRKGGGRYQIGKPYKVRGRWYHPKDDKNLNQVGLASWYGPNFHGRLTANGEIYDQYTLSAAHPTMPLPSYARVTNLKNGRQVMVRVNDRGPFAHNRIIDLSSRAADLLDFKKKGVAKVKVEYAGRARMDGLDEAVLLASYRGPDGSNRLPAEFAHQTRTLYALANQAQSSGGASGAISSSFEPSATLLSANAPVPTARPATFKGTPLADGRNLIRALPNHGMETAIRAFVDENTNSMRLYAPYLGTQPNRSVELVLGLPDNKEAELMVRGYFADMGVIKTDSISNELVLLTTESEVNKIMVLAGQSGLAPYIK